MKTISRTIKNTQVTFFNANMVTMSIEEHTEIIPSGMSEAQAKKHLIGMGYNNPMELKIENIPAHMIEMRLDDFIMFGNEIDKKSDIVGRSVTKEVEYSFMDCVVAEKQFPTGEWVIKHKEYLRIDGEFSTADYNTKELKILEAEPNDLKPNVKALIGMSESMFETLGTLK